MVHLSRSEGSARALSRSRLRRTMCALTDRSDTEGTPRIAIARPSGIALVCRHPDLAAVMRRLRANRSCVARLRIDRFRRLVDCGGGNVTRSPCPSAYSVEGFLVWSCVSTEVDGDGEKWSTG